MAGTQPWILMIGGLCGAASLVLAAPGATLEVVSSGQTIRVDLNALGRKHPVQKKKMKVEDPVYKRPKTYEGYLLLEWLEAVGIRPQDEDEIVFHCADGYAPSLSWGKARLRQGLLAIRDVGAKGGWEKILQGKAWISPAPAYLVWDTTDEPYPWPYQLVRIEIAAAREKFARIYPEGESKDSLVARGFAAFRQECLRCHSLNLQGGTLGPELNYPKSITEYWEEGTLLRFIRDPGEFRARSKMPAFGNLGEEQLKAILAYLKWMRGKKQGDST